MKIGLVLDDTLDTPDGVQQYVVRIGTWFQSHGHEVHYLVGYTTRSDIDHIHSLSRNLRVRFNGNRMSMPLPTSRRKLRTFLQNEPFDVLHIQVPYSPFMAGQLLAVVPSQTAVIGTFHILPYSRLVTAANRLLSLINNRSARRFDAMLAVSQPAADFARRIYGFRASVIPNPVDLAQFSGAINTSPQLNVVFLGRLVARKGARQLLEALNYMVFNKLVTNDIWVHIGGKGDQLAELRRYTTEHHLHDMVQFTGFINEEVKPDFLAQADIAVYPSLGGESFGIVLLEGMAAARGVVLAGNNPGYASVMQPFPGQLVSPGDTPAFAHILATYLTDEAARHQAAQAQRKYVKQFDVSVVCTKLLRVYEQALQDKRKT